LPSSGAKTKTDDEEEQKKPGRQPKEEKFHAMNPSVNTGLTGESSGSCKSTRMMNVSFVRCNQSYEDGSSE
jgi:hypothetical protein